MNCLADISKHIKASKSHGKQVRHTSQQFETHRLVAKLLTVYQLSGSQEVA